MLNIPIRSVVRDYKELSSYGSVVRKELNQVVTVFSSVDPFGLNNSTTNV